MKALEVVLTTEQLELYKKRYEEGYDIRADQVYNVWHNLKVELEGPDNDRSEGCKEVFEQNLKPESGCDEGNMSPAREGSVQIQVTPSSKTQPVIITVSSILDDILVLPKAPEKQKKKKIASLPDYRHLSGDQMIAYLEKKDKIRKEETERKLQAKAEREAKRLAKQVEREKMSGQS